MKKILLFASCFLTICIVNAIGFWNYSPLVGLYKAYVDGQLVSYIQLYISGKCDFYIKENNVFISKNAERWMRFDLKINNVEYDNIQISKKNDNNVYVVINDFYVINNNLVDSKSGLIYEK